LKKKRGEKDAGRPSERNSTSRKNKQFGRGNPEGGVGSQAIPEGRGFTGAQRLQSSRHNRKKGGLISESEKIGNGRAGHQ